MDRHLRQVIRPHHHHHHPQAACLERALFFVSGACESDDSVHGDDMNGCRSHVLWQRRSTTPPGPSLRRATRGWWRVPRTTPYEARTQSPEPAPLVEVRPQAGIRRHTGVGYELVLDPVVPQMAEKLVEVFDIPVLCGGRSLPLGDLPGFHAQDMVPLRLVCDASACCGVHPTCAGLVSFPCDSGGVYCTHNQQQWFYRQRQWWIILHPRQQLSFRLRQLRSLLHPCQRCFKRQRL